VKLNSFLVLKGQVKVLNINMILKIHFTFVTAGINSQEKVLLFTKNLLTK
jgi:hypothetical protein